MSNNKKLLDRLMKSEKIPNDIMPKEFLSLVSYLGYKTREGSGSHTIVYDGKWFTTVATGHSVPVDPKAVKTLIEKVKEDKENGKK